MMHDAWHRTVRHLARLTTLGPHATPSFKISGQHAKTTLLALTYTTRELRIRLYRHSSCATERSYQTALHPFNMGLGGRRQKQVIQADPRNTAWANNREGNGYKMLAQMGWKPEGERDPSEAASGLFAHESTRRLRAIPIAKAGMEGIGFKPNAANNSAGPGLGGAAPGGGSMASAASSMFSRMGSKAALQFVTAGASKEVINRAKTEGGEFAGLLSRLNAAATSTDASPAESDAEAEEDAEAAGETSIAKEGETKAERRERRRKRKAEKEAKREAKRAKKAAKKAAASLPTPEASSDEAAASSATTPAIAPEAAPILAVHPALFNPRMAYVLSCSESTRL